MIKYHRADEAARAAQMYAAEGLAPPPGSSHRTRLDALLRCVERLYARDPHHLRHEYWLACDATAPSHRYNYLLYNYMWIKLNSRLGV